MNFTKNYKINLVRYYLVGLISFILGYSIFVLVYFESGKMYFSLISQYIFVFFFKYFIYVKYLFTKLTLTKYFFTCLVLLILNSFFLYIVNLKTQNIYILQFIYILFISFFGFLLLKYLNK